LRGIGMGGILLVMRWMRWFGILILVMRSGEIEDVVVMVTVMTLDIRDRVRKSSIDDLMYKRALCRNGVVWFGAW
jgi:hypothetical protein